MIQTEHTDYLVNDPRVQKIMGRLYEAYISKCLDGNIKCMPWWGIYKDKYKKTGEVPPPLKGAMDQDFYHQSKNAWKDYVSYEKYEWKRKNLRAEDYDASVHEKIWWRPQETRYFKREWFQQVFFDEIQEILTELVRDKWGDYYLKKMIGSNKPMWYKKYKGTEGFMGWHTNSDKPGHRWYLVYNTHNNSSCMRFIDPDTKKLVTKWEPKGWIINYFYLSPSDKPLWHSVYTKSNRFSFGQKILDEEHVFNKGYEEMEY